MLSDIQPKRRGRPTAARPNHQAGKTRTRSQAGRGAERKNLEPAVTGAELDAGAASARRLEPVLAADPAKLAELGAEAAADHAPPAADPAELDAGQGAPAPAAVDAEQTADEVRAMLDFGLMAGDGAYPGMADIWTDDARDKVSTRAAAVLIKYGLTGPAWMARWGEEISLAIILAPLVKATLQLIKAKNDNPPANDKPGAPAARATPASDSLTIAEPAPAKSSAAGAPLTPSA